MTTKILRAKKIFFVSECILNQNIRAYGVGNMDGSGAVCDIVNLLTSNNIGIAVVPCPELEYEGLKRKACNKDSYENLIYHKICVRAAEDVIKRYKMYLDDDYKVGGFICINGSPTCAIDYCFRGKTVNKKCKESGVFVEELQKKLKDENLDLTFIGMRIKDMPIVLEKIKKIIKSI